MRRPTTRYLATLLILGLALWLLALPGCRTAGGIDAGEPAEKPAPTTEVRTPAPPPPTPTRDPGPNPDLPVGLPLDPSIRPMRVVETAQGKTVVPAAPNGPTVEEVARHVHSRSQNDEESNRYGWNCRVHNRYEGAPAVDWYLPHGTPVIATMRGKAELYVITTVNAFEYYGVDPRITLGLPSPSMPVFPLPGPGGGMGVFVSILNGELRAEYGHLDLKKTLTLVPDSAFVPPYSRSFDYDSRFGRPIGHDQITLVASWPVERGDVVGYVGNTGYSDVDHLHYQVVTRDRTIKFCPTFEGFPNAGWLFQRP